MLRRIRNEEISPALSLSDLQLRALLLGVVTSVVVGNAYFWGSLNILGDPTRTGDGLVSLLGPFYHFDLLVPVAAFSAHGTLTVARWIRDRLDRRAPTPHRVRAGIVLLLVGSVALVGVAEAAVLQPPIARNEAYTEKFASADAPLEAADLHHALVFLPPEYGEWRNHPFQWRRNDPGFDGSVVYVLSRTPAADLAVLDAYPDRTAYRYRYHGEWTPDPTAHVVPILDRLERVNADAVTARTTVTVPDRIVAVRLGIHADGESVRYRYEGDPPDRLAVEWSVGPEGLAVVSPDLDRLEGDPGPLPIDGPTEVALTVTITEPSGTTLTYREGMVVRPTPGGIEAIWPPTSTACPLQPNCGLAGTYVPDRPDTRPTDITMNTTRVQ
ncbi:MAG: hypothetical protein R3324_17745, partial [Halobacteriales archaeon]|nr:hypothetical protein [Halobacteriales archaeon]